MALVLASDTSHANGNITVVTNKNTIFFVFFTSQFYFRDDIFTALKLVIFCSFHPLMQRLTVHTEILLTLQTKVCTRTPHTYFTSRQCGLSHDTVVNRSICVIYIGENFKIRTDYRQRYEKLRLM
jgi:hypothetical protein